MPPTRSGCRPAFGGMWPRVRTASAFHARQHLRARFPYARRTPRGLRGRQVVPVDPLAGVGGAIAHRRSHGAYRIAAVVRCSRRSRSDPPAKRIVTNALFLLPGHWRCTNCRAAGGNCDLPPAAPASGLKYRPCRSTALPRATSQRPVSGGNHLGLCTTGSSTSKAATGPHDPRGPVPALGGSRSAGVRASRCVPGHGPQGLPTLRRPAGGHPGPLRNVDPTAAPLRDFRVKSRGVV